ncbi:MAG: nitroreductase family protein [Chloroflexota bacterium]|nr:nitroreductase family protein [Chloroflexota bacterium]
MQIDEFVKLAKTRRSIRKFRPDPIPDGCIEKMIDAARFAQSGANAQSWEFIVVKDRATRDKITDLVIESKKYTWDIEKTRLEEIRHPGFAHGRQGEPVSSFREAPVFIVVCGDPRTVQATVLISQFLNNEGGPFAHFLKNIGNATQILQLAAAACGLGAQWVSINSTIEARLKTLLDVPVELSIHTVVPIGYPAYTPAPAYRREVNEITHYEKYDRSKYRSGDDICNFLVNLRKKTIPAYPGKPGQKV